MPWPWARSRPSGSPISIERLTDRYVAERNGEESFQIVLPAHRQAGAQEQSSTNSSAVPPHKDDPSFYSDWGDPREFTIGDMGVGECAGEIVSLAQFGFTQAESEAFEAQLLLDAGQFQQADENGVSGDAHRGQDAGAIAMARCAERSRQSIVEEFRKRFVEPKLFWDTYHHGQFANYLLARHEGADLRYTQDTAHKLVEEANLFIDAAHKCHAKIQSQNASAAQPGRGQ